MKSKKSENKRLKIISRSPNSESQNGNEEWIKDRIIRLHHLMVSSDYKGNDPFDILNSPFFKHLPCWHPLMFAISRFGSRIASDRLRKFLRVPPVEDPKTYALAYFGYRILGDEYGSSADLMIERLAKLAKHDQHGSYWGYDFTWPTRSDGINKRGASTLVPASFALFSLLYETIVCQNEKHIPLVKSGIEYFVNRHLRENSSGRFLGYFTHSKVNTHNANLLGCAVLSLGAQFFGNNKWAEIAAEASYTSLRAVENDGYLPYNDHATGNWTDSFHHLYVIAMLSVIENTNQFIYRDHYANAITRLRRYYKSKFINDDGTIDYFPDKQNPVDPHNYAASIIYGLLFDSGKLMDELDTSELLSRINSIAWSKKSKRYTHRIKDGKKDNRLFLRWTQVWMFLALSTVLKGNSFNQDILKAFSKFNHPPENLRTDISTAPLYI
ncbi:MAG: hypothetical protein GY855_08350 [candidate division Zixibacteria bacterium]|nr:hypothetical protein [candidate division Zixibacteria bacterium]